jgi:transposase-like protein
MRSSPLPLNRALMRVNRSHCQVTIGGNHMYLWRAVDDEGEVLNLVVQKKRDTCAACSAVSP